MALLHRLASAFEMEVEDYCRQLLFESCLEDKAMRRLTELAWQVLDAPGAGTRTQDAVSSLLVALEQHRREKAPPLA